MIFTIGHSNLSIEKFLSRLNIYGVKQLVDIRTIPRSRYNPQFNNDALEKSLNEAGIKYLHLKDLGGLRKAKANSINTGFHSGGFRGYADYMQSAEFKTALEKLINLSQAEPTAIMCAEAVPWRCHRSLVSDALVVNGIEVVAIISETDSRKHKLTSFAKLEGDTLIYPSEQTELF